jgi:glycerophosphoryl diester phosphodiesterase
MNYYNFFDYYCIHTGTQARYYYDRFPGIMLSVFARDHKEYEDIAISGVPWRNMIAYVGPDIIESDLPLEIWTVIND